jgi:Right handed beta helix region
MSLRRTMCKALLSSVLIVLGLATTSGSAVRDRVDERATIEWPSAAFPELQAAIDAAPDGATVKIRPGVYRIDEPILVAGKRVVIRGAGSGLHGDYRVTPVTHLIGPPPREVVDEQGNLVLPSDQVRGLLNFRAADSTVQDLRLSGFDAAIVYRDDEQRTSAPARVSDVVISDTGRGILSRSSGNLAVSDVAFTRTKWNAISVAFEGLADLNVADVSILDPQGAGIYFENANVSITDAFITGAVGGGINGFQSGASISGSTLIGNYKFGIGLLDSTAFIVSNHILDTFPDKLSGAFGDAITLFKSGSLIEDNVIHHADRVGISFFGSSGFLADNGITCCSLADVQIEDFEGQEGNAIDGGGNVCGCQQPTVCAVISSGGPQAPPPMGEGGLE